ncbi:MAG: redox-sensing transcriptional repressor Rex, partial [Oscillospiraceae bacterium]
RLGRALMGYGGFAQHGLNILAAFDCDPALAYTESDGKPILPMEKLPDLCLRLQAHIGILTVPAFAAQPACDLLVANGILAIWNFAPVRLAAPPEVLIQNENMASSLAVLSNHLSEKLTAPTDKPPQSKQKEIGR